MEKNNTDENISGEVLTKQEYFADPTFPLQIYIRDPQPDFPLHSHSFDELVVVLSGTAIHVVDKERFPVKGGDVFVIAPRQIHKYEERHDLVLANILFDSKALNMDKWDIRALSGFHALFLLEPTFRIRHQFKSRLQLNENQLLTVKHWIHDIEKESTRRSPGYRVMAIGIFMQLAVYLSRRYSEEPTEESLDLLRIGDAIAHMESCYQEDMNLEELAKISHFSKRHFQRIFQECIGHSPMEHLRHIRIERAAEALHDTEKTITEIAFECGFSDSNYFTRCFKKILGQTPREYREGAHEAN